MTVTSAKTQKAAMKELTAAVLPKLIASAAESLKPSGKKPTPLTEAVNFISDKGEKLDAKSLRDLNSKLALDHMNDLRDGVVERHLDKAKEEVTAAIDHQATFDSTNAAADALLKAAKIDDSQAAVDQRGMDGNAPWGAGRWRGNLGSVFRSTNDPEASLVKPPNEVFNALRERVMALKQPTPAFSPLLPIYTALNRALNYNLGDKLYQEGRKETQTLTFDDIVSQLGSSSYGQSFESKEDPLYYPEHKTLDVVDKMAECQRNGTLNKDATRIFIATLVATTIRGYGVSQHYEDPKSEEIAIGNRYGSGVKIQEIKSTIRDIRRAASAIASHFAAIAPVTEVMQEMMRCEHQGSVDSDALTPGGIYKAARLMVRQGPRGYGFGGEQKYSKVLGYTFPEYETYRGDSMSNFRKTSPHYPKQLQVDALDRRELNFTELLQVTRDTNPLDSLYQTLKVCYVVYMLDPKRAHTSLGPSYGNPY